MLAYPLARMRFAGAALIVVRRGRDLSGAAAAAVRAAGRSSSTGLGLGDTLTSVILTYPTLLIPFCAWLLMGYFRTVPIELEDAARIDGASRLQTLVKIVLPLCGPGFISAGIFAFTLAQNEFLYALIFLTKTDGAHGPGRRHRRAGPGRRVLLGPADGGCSAWLAAGCLHLLVLCGALCRWPDRRIGEGLTATHSRRVLTHPPPRCSR